MTEKEPRGFKKAKQKAESFLSNKEKLKKLLQDGEQKALAKKQKLESVWTDVQTLFRLVKAWVKKEYTAIPWKSILYIIASVLYFVNPLDVIPDFIPLTGLLDDITILTFVINSVKGDIEEFKKWEISNEEGETIS